MVICLFGFGDVEKRVPFVFALMQSLSVMQPVRLESTVPDRKLDCASLQAESRARLRQGPMCWAHIDKSACSFSVLDLRFATPLRHSPRGQTASLLLEPATSFPWRSSPRDSGGGEDGSLSRHCRESV